jgi:hypothetical protein
MMPLDVGAHLPVQIIKNTRTEDLVDDVHSGFNIIADAARCHVPGAVNRLRGAQPCQRA